MHPSYLAESLVDQRVKYGVLLMEYSVLRTPYLQAQFYSSTIPCTTFHQQPMNMASFVTNPLKLTYKLGSAATIRRL